MISVDLGRLLDEDLERLSRLWFALTGDEQGSFHKSTPLGAFLFELACDLQGELGDRRTALHAMEIDLGEIGRLVEDPARGDDNCQGGPV